MNFYERYARICADRRIDPCSQRAAEMFGVTRATISIWNKKNTAPKAETVLAMADALCVSADYLLGRTEDPTDYSSPELIASFSNAVLDEFGGDVRKAKAFRDATDADVEKEQEHAASKQFNKLDDVDKIKAGAYIDGLLASDKYSTDNK